MKKNQTYQGRDATRLPMVYITPKAKAKLDLYVAEVPAEVSGLGTVEIFGKEKNAFLITDVFLFKQECTGVETKLSSGDVSRFLIESIKAGHDPALIKCWWHSHVDMPVFWSATDDFTAGSFANGFMLSLVANKHREYLCRLDLYEPFRFTVDNLPLEVLFTEDLALREMIKREVKEKVFLVEKKHKLMAALFGPNVLTGEFDEEGT